MTASPTDLGASHAANITPELVAPALILTRGIPASGKSTWAKAWVAESPTNRIRVNRDDMRLMLHGVAVGLSRSDELCITRYQQQIVRHALANGYSVVLDETNLNDRTVAAWLKFSANVQFKDFPINVDLAVQRDAARTRPIGEDVIRQFAARLNKDGTFPAPGTRPAASTRAHQLGPKGARTPGGGPAARHLRRVPPNSAAQPNR